MQKIQSMKTQQFNYAVTLYASNREEYTLKTFTSLQNARRFIKKEQECVRWGLPMKNGMAFRIYKIDISTNRPITIYLN